MDADESIINFAPSNDSKPPSHTLKSTVNTKIKIKFKNCFKVKWYGLRFDGLSVTFT